MKKNLQLALALMLGVATTVSAQDWSVDSRSRINMSGDNDRFETEQRVRMGASFGGDDWSINVSADANYDVGINSSILDQPNALSATIHEAYATANVLGYDLSVGRQALEFGNGSIIGANDFGKTAYTRDGATVSMDFSGVDVTLMAGSRTNDQPEGSAYYGSGSYMGANLMGSMSEFGYNFVYISQSSTMSTAPEETLSAMGLDVSYSTMGANLMFSYNTVNDDSDNDMDYYAVGIEYPVSEALTVEGKLTQYGENGFALTGTNMGANYTNDDGQTFNSWETHGNMGFLQANDQMMSFGGSYDMGDFSVGVSVNQVTNDDYDSWERNVTMLDLGYKLGNNSSFSLMYATDDNRMNSGTEETYMYGTLKVGL